MLIRESNVPIAASIRRRQAAAFGAQPVRDALSSHWPICFFGASNHECTSIQPARRRAASARIRRNISEMRRGASAT